MGYTTDFEGEFTLNKKLDKETHEFLNKLNDTRRMKRKLDAKYGVDGEFFVDGEGFEGQTEDDSVIDGNQPPSTQPSLWCQWKPSEDGMSIKWDYAEKFYSYVEWIEYIVNAILAPKGYVLNGEVTWQGEEQGDIGKIIIEDNQIAVKEGKIVYE